RAWTTRPATRRWKSASATGISKSPTAGRRGRKDHAEDAEKTDSKGFLFCVLCETSASSAYKKAFHDNN
ncbi:MAG TPA: hypothetical protein PLH50_10805, partial [Ottowia beijingensis]|nr:hypothetical protein [Ottowia beijingensis]